VALASADKPIELQFPLTVGRKYTVNLTSGPWRFLHMGTLVIPVPPLDKGGQMEERCSDAAVKEMRVTADGADEQEFRLFSAVAPHVRPLKCQECRHPISQKHEVRFSAYSNPNARNIVALAADDSDRPDHVTSWIVVPLEPQCHASGPFPRIATEPLTT